MLNLKRARIFACLLLVALACNGKVFALTVSLEPGFDSQWLGPGMEYIEDDSTDLSVQDVQQRSDWQVFEGHEVNFGFSD